MFGWEVRGGVAGRGFCTDSVGALLLLWTAGLQALGGVTLGTSWGIDCGTGAGVWVIQ